MAVSSACVPGLLNGDEVGRSCFGTFVTINYKLIFICILSNQCDHIMITDEQEAYFTCYSYHDSK